MTFRRKVATKKFAKQISDAVVSYIVETTNGDDEIRTHDPLLARQVLSQLSYAPKRVLIKISTGLKWTRTTDLTLIRRAL